MSDEKPKKQLKTPVLVVAIFLATVLILGGIVLSLLLLTGSDGPARTDLGNELVATIEVADELIEEIESIEGCDIDTEAITKKNQELDERVIAIFGQVFGQFASDYGQGAPYDPDQDLIDDFDRYSPRLESQGQKLTELGSELEARCGSSLIRPSPIWSDL